MAVTDAWETSLQDMDRSAWPAYVEANSGLPGARANLSLVAAVARLADESDIDVLLRDGGEYQSMCAAAALGRRADRAGFEERARALAVDDRWRVREGVVIGLQLLGDAAPGALIELVRKWADDPEFLVQRAAIAAICEPRLLKAGGAAAVAVDLCRRCTLKLATLPTDSRTSADVRTLRQALGYCWSVAVAADPSPGLAAFKALDIADPDVGWIVKENLRKKRLSALL